MWPWRNRAKRGDVPELCRWMEGSSHCVVLTGAGVSTESGIPDFRSPGSGLWTRIDPMEAFSTGGFLRNPARLYDIGRELLPIFLGAKPCEIHLLLADLEEAGVVKAVITQNIDGLHRAAGSKNVYEVHGNLRECICLDCGRKSGIDLILSRLGAAGSVPRCDCGGLLKPNIVLFGDMLPEDYDRACLEVERCDLLVVMGSSLEIAPVNFLPRMAKRSGARVAIVNRERTAQDGCADICVRGNLGELAKEMRRCFLCRDGGVFG
ncbi:MAG: SIR2 family NAD-dependent protein deacylase [bacterium]